MDDVREGIGAENPMEIGTDEARDHLLDRQGPLLFDSWHRQVEQKKSNSPFQLNKEPPLTRRLPIFIDDHGDGPPIFNEFFPLPTVVIVTTDGHRVGVNRAVLIENSSAFYSDLVVLSRNIVEVPAAFEPMILLISAFYTEELTCLFLHADLSLLFAVYDAAVALDFPLVRDEVAVILEYRVEFPTLVATMQKLAAERPDLAGNLWKSVVGEFYRFISDSSIRLLTPRQMDRLLFHEPVNVQRGDELEIFRHWEETARPNDVVQVDEMANRLIEMLSGGPTRRPYSVLLTLGGWAAEGPTSRLELFDGYSGSWVDARGDLGDLPYPHCYHAAVAMPDSVHVLGGMDGDFYFESSFCFDLQNLQWTPGARMNERRCYVMAARLDDSRVLACGGYDRTSRHRSAELFDMEQNEWTAVNRMNVVRSDGAAAELDGKMYVLGGFDGRTCHRSVEFYDPHVDRWILLESGMRDKRSGVGALTTHGVLMAVGGFSGRQRLATVEFYDPREGLWHAAQSMAMSRSNFGFTQLRDDPVVVGGYDGHSTTERVEFYDWRANCWTPGPPLRHRRSALSLVRVDDVQKIDQLVCSQWNEI